MEYLEGKDLNTLVKERGALPADEASRYLLQACEAIDEAHRMGIVHRDLKPHNLFLTHDIRGEPCIKVLDFGIAKLLSAEELTHTRDLLGTPAYMSPQQIQSARHVDARADIWSLGVIMYRLVAGVLPFSGNSPMLLLSLILDASPARPPSVHKAAIPRSFDAIVLRCLEKNIRERFQTVDEVVTALQPFVEKHSDESLSSAKHSDASEDSTTKPHEPSAVVISEATTLVRAPVRGIAQAEGSLAPMSDITPTIAAAPLDFVDRSSVDSREPDTQLTEEPKRRGMSAHRVMIGSGVLGAIVAGSLMYIAISAQKERTAQGPSPPPTPSMSAGTSIQQTETSLENHIAEAPSTTAAAQSVPSSSATDATKKANTPPPKKTASSRPAAAPTGVRVPVSPAPVPPPATTAPAPPTNPWAGAGRSG